MTELFRTNFYNKNILISQKEYSLNDCINEKFFEIHTSKNSCKNGQKTVDVIFTAKKDINNCGISVVFETYNHNITDYIFAPSALYNGNRFYSFEREYPSMYVGDDIEISKKSPVITDVPRLSLDGKSFVQLNVGDLSTACVGYFSETEKKGILLFFNAQNECGNMGLTVEENIETGLLRFYISSPCIREKTKYAMCTTKEKSDDCAIALKKGCSATFNIEQYSFKCTDKTEFLNTFFEHRLCKSNERSLKNDVSWSYAFDLIENKYNKNNWVSDGMFYKSSEATGNSVTRQWQTGWVGGAINTLPSLFSSNKESVEKSAKTLDFVFNRIQHKSGFLYGIYCDGKIYGDCFYDIENKNIVMSRKNADAMYYIAKQLLCLQKSGKEVPDLWENGLKKLADAFVAYYEKNKEFSQFMDIENMKPFIASTASASIAPAGLVLCSIFFNNKKYLDIACDSAEKYYNSYILQGFTNGGPGEILGCPDSESAFALLESLASLYCETKDDKWLARAVDTASLCSSWCVSYDYKYEKNTQWYKRKIATTGAVWASVQNKHAAPGICTLSGASLFKLFRATGNIEYLKLCRDISHSITQYVSTPNNPTYCSYIWNNRNIGLQKSINSFYAQALKKLHSSGKFGEKITDKLYNTVFNLPGRIGERCNLSDWEGTANVGEFPGGSCWCEVSAMLTYFELPGIYVNPDTEFVFVLDHAEAKAENGLLIIKNITENDSNYRIFIENESNRKNPLEETYMIDFKNVFVPAHKSVEIKLKK